MEAWPRQSRKAQAPKSMGQANRSDHVYFVMYGYGIVWSSGFRLHGLHGHPDRNGFQPAN